jgi:hypothetical protein
MTREIHTPFADEDDRLGFVNFSFDQIGLKCHPWFAFNTPRNPRFSRWKLHQILALQHEPPHDVQRMFCRIVPRPLHIQID